MSTFQKAVRGDKLLRIVIGGETDAGKSFTSLVFATELAGISNKRSAVVDTENGRLKHRYASKFDFDVVEPKPPFEPSALTKLIHEAEAGGYGQLIIDSGSDYYEGMLAQVKTQAGQMRSAKSQAPNAMAAWGKVTPTQNELYDSMLRSSMHVLFTVRERSGTLLQRADFAFKFDLVLVMDKAHTATVRKSFNDDFPVGREFDKPNGNLIRMMLGKPRQELPDLAWAKWQALVAKAILIGVPYPQDVVRESVGVERLRVLYAKLDGDVKFAEKMGYESQFVDLCIRCNYDSQKRAEILQVCEGSYRTACEMIAAQK